MTDLTWNIDETTSIDTSAFSSRISSQYATLSKTQRKIAKYFENNKQEILNCSITVLAKKIGTTPSAISRFCQALHYKGFSDMRFSIEKDLVYIPELEEESELSSDISQIKKKYLNLYNKSLTDTLLNLDDRSIRLAAKSIQNANHVYIYSSGNSGASACYIFQLFMQLEIPCNYFVDRQLAFMSIQQLKRGDVAIAVNYSGASSSVLELLTLAKQNHVTTIAITSDAQSYIARIADIPLCYSTIIEDDIKQVHAARMCELAIIGLLQTVIIQLAASSKEDYLKYTKLAIEKSRTK